MNGNPDGPRCGHPIRYYDAPGRDDYPFPECFRPAGHPGGQHLSQWAYRRKLARPGGSSWYAGRRAA